VSLRVARGPVCAAELTLFGPRGRVYGRAGVAVLNSGARAVRLRATRRLVRGRYRLRVVSEGRRIRATGRARR
jgi:hypothetical protein